MRVRPTRPEDTWDGATIADGTLPPELVQLVTSAVDGVRDLPPRAEPLWPNEMVTWRP